MVNIRFSHFRPFNIHNNDISDIDKINSCLSIIVYIQSASLFFKIHINCYLYNYICEKDKKGVKISILHKSKLMAKS